MNIHIDVSNITKAQRSRLINLLDSTGIDQDIEITNHPDKPQWLLVEDSAGQVQIDDVGCMRSITYGDWSDPA